MRTTFPPAGFLPRFLLVCVVMAATAPAVPPASGQTHPEAEPSGTEPSRAADASGATGLPRVTAPPQGTAPPTTATTPATAPAVAAERSLPDAAANIDFDEAIVDDRIGFIERRLTESLSRVESLLGTIELGVLKVQKKTLLLRRELEDLRAELAEQERLTAQDMRNRERLVDLVERYGAGDWVARHIKVELEKFRRQGRWSAAPSADEAGLSRELREYRQSLFELGTLMFSVESDERDYAQALAAEAQSAPEATSRLDGLLAERRKALQAQERVLNDLSEAGARLQELKRQREEQLEGLYTFVLGRLLWLQNREPLGPFPPNRAFFERAFDGAWTFLERISALLLAESQASTIRFAASSRPWLWVGLLFGVLPFLAGWTYRALRARLTPSRPEARMSGAGAVCLLAFRAAVWPFYLILVALTLPWLGLLQYGSLGPALTQAIELGGLVLWISLFGHVMLRPNGYGEQYWQLAPEAGRLLRMALAPACIAALLLLIPRHVLLTAPGTDFAASLALARLLMIGFAVVMLVLVVILGRRDSAVVKATLDCYGARGGFVWSAWPVGYLALVVALTGTILLNVAGYQYASQFIWQRLMGTVLVVVGALLMAGYLNRSIRAVGGRLASRRGAVTEAAGETADAGGLGSTLAVVLAEIVLWLVVAAVLLELWGVSVIDFMATPMGETVMYRGFLVSLVIAAGFGVVYLSNAVVVSLLRPEVVDPAKAPEAGRRLQTLAPLTQTFVKFLVFVSGLLLALQLVGVQIGPLLAGVGIFGLAVGFAAQSLIKDIINGLFILTEGSVGAGDVVEVGGVSGVVEKVSLRSVRVRDLSGNVHFVPNSSIDSVKNMTKDFSRYLLDVGVAYRENTDEVVAVMQEVDEEMRRDPLFAGDMLEPIEIMGVDRFDDSAVVVRARLKTRPIRQWRVGREYNRRLKKAFDGRGIEIPFPHRTIYWGETKQGQLPLQVESRARARAADSAAQAAPETEKKQPEE